MCSVYVYIKVCGRVCVLLSFSPYSRRGCTVGGNRCSLCFCGQRYQDSGGVVAHKLALTGVLCVYLIHDCRYKRKTKTLKQ